MKNNHTHIITLAAAASLSATAAFGSTESASLDFTASAGKIRRELHSSGWGGQLVGAGSSRYPEMKALNLTAARTHDWALNNPGQRVCDIHFVFPLLHADTNDPRNYYFGPTDEILAMTIEDLGMDVLYRMGTSIEGVNRRRKSKTRPSKYYNSVEPTDWEQFTKAHANIIRHYTEGWANGYRWGDKMKYWELWNEPNDVPGGSWIRADGNRDKAANDERFWEFAVYVLKRLKAQFPHLKFGAPATCFYDEDFLKGFLSRCKAEGYAPDFVSWHGYGGEPEVMLAEPAQARKLVDGFGFTKCELFIDEWHYIPGPEAWRKLGSAPAIYTTMVSPEDGLLSADAAVYALQVIMGLQSTCLDQSYYYGCAYDRDGHWSCLDRDDRWGKSYYTLRFFGDVVGACDTFVKGEDPLAKNPVRCFGAWSRDGKRAYLIATVYHGAEEMFEVRAKGLEKMQVKSVQLVDKATTGAYVEPSRILFRDGDVLRFRKADALRASAYLVMFE